MEHRTVNRRAFPRWKTLFEVRYGTAKDMQDAEPLEIGEGGLSLGTDRLLPLETELTVEYCLPGEEKNWVKVKGIVRHSEGRKLGVEFLNLRRADRLKIIDYISAIKA